MEGTLNKVNTGNGEKTPGQCFLISSGREKEPLLKGTYSHDTNGRQITTRFILRQFDAIK